MDLMVHHPCHDTLPCVCRLNCDISHACDCCGTAWNGHFNHVGVGATDYIGSLEYADGTFKVKMRTQYLRIVV